MIVTLFVLVQAAATQAPTDCLLTGLCGAVQDERTIPSGVLYLAVGLVLAGAWGLQRSRGHSGS